MCFTRHCCVPPLSFYIFYLCTSLLMLSIFRSLSHTLYPAPTYNPLHSIPVHGSMHNKNQMQQLSCIGGVVARALAHTTLHCTHNTNVNEASLLIPDSQITNIHTTMPTLGPFHVLHATLLGQP